MKLAVALRFDLPTAATIAGLQVQLGDDATMHDPYPAHITLAAFETERTPASLWEDLLHIAGHWTPMAISMPGFGIFPGKRPAIWAAPIMTSDLVERQQLVLQAMDGVSMFEHFLPGHWLAHVTIATRIRSVGQTIELLSAHWQPIDGRLDHLDLISFPPVAIHHSYHLDD